MSPRILFATSECSPIVKTGGLADVAGALPAALRAAGCDVRVLLPGYPAALRALGPLQEAGRVDAFAGLPAVRIMAATLDNGVPVLAVDAPELFEREGGPYGDAEGRDWPDNARRFGLFCRVAALLASRATPLPWRADVLHANDWQAGLAPAYLALSPGQDARSVVTIHNLAFQGIFDPATMSLLGLPESAFSMYGVEYYGRLSFMKAALYYADAITTVSPTYAREIQSPPLGMGFEGLLAGRRDRLRGILNGIDTEIWNPRTDPHLAAPYDAGSLERKAESKRALQARFGLPQREDVPLLGCVTRLTHQKGVDVIAALVDEIVAAPAQLVVVGTGERAEEDAFRAIAHRHRDSVGVFIGFDEGLAHRVEAGADAFLMPSRFEPCGMNQMYSQRYGTPPVVHATGGLVDSVVDTRPETLADGTASGFVFNGVDRDSLSAAVRRALNVWRDRSAWRRIQRNGMTRDFSWDAAAREYASLYRSLAR